MAWKHIFECDGCDIKITNDDTSVHQEDTYSVIVGNIVVAQVCSVCKNKLQALVNSNTGMQKAIKVFLKAL